MLKHQLYPLIEKYIKEYLHGFTKRQFEVAITKGELKFQYLNLRPDTINKKMDEKNIPFWLKAGLIKKINIGCSVMNIIGEIPLELKIEGFDIIINPSYKWIIKNTNLDQKNIIKSQFFGDFQNLNVKSPLNIDFKKSTSDFDKSIFTQIKELFKDKSIISYIINIFFEKCYKFYLQKNTPVSIKMKNIHIRFEDDFFINYNENIVFGVRIDSIDIKLGKKGNMKKNYVIISKLDMYWENEPKILIPSYFLYSLYINDQLQESYYTQLHDIKFQNFNYQRNTKFIIENFNSTINFGTKILNNSKNLDIFNIKDKPCILYVQISTDEININVWPEIIKIFTIFKQFTDKFKIIGKIEEFKPKNKPYVQDQNKNIFKVNNNNLDNDKKILVRNWLYYFLFCTKMKKYISSSNNNPLRLEFLRYFNIFCKKADVSEKKEEEKNEVKKDNKYYSTKNINNDLPIKIIQNENNNNIELKNDISSSDKKNSFDFFSLGSKTNNNKNRLIFSNKSVINVNSFLNEQKRKQNEENIKLKQINLLFISDILIKSIKINMYPSLTKDTINYLKFRIKNIQTRILLSKEKLDISVSTKNIDFTPYNIVYGERELLSEESYRKLYQEPENNIKENETLNMSSYPYYITTEFNNNINYNNLMNNSFIYKNQANDNRMRNMNDALSIDENNRRSRGSSLGSRRNAYSNMNNINNNYINNNYINNNIGNNGMNNRPLNTMGNFNYHNKLNNSNINLYMTNNPQGHSRFNSFDNNSINNGIINRKSFIKMTVGRKANISFLEDEKHSPNKANNKLTKKQRKELDISKAVNNYNSYKIKQRSFTPVSMIRRKQIKKSMNKKSDKKEPFSNKNIPLKLLEIYSNSNSNSFNLSFVKYNNPVSIDSFTIKIGTIRTNLFVNYLQECLKIFNDYSKFINYEKDKKWLDYILHKRMETNKELFYMKDYFYKKINMVPDYQKTEGMIKYSEYLRKEIMLMKIFNSKVADFELNYLFSIFNNGIKFNFSFENIECVYYSKYKKISGKFILPLNELELIINLKKIHFKIFGMELQINDLEDTKLIIKKIKKIFESKMAMAEILIEPCYTMLKNELEKENKINKSNDLNKEEQHENVNNKFTNVKTNDEIKNIITNTNINSNKIFFDDNNILLNSFQKDKSEDEKNNKNDNDILLNSFNKDKSEDEKNNKKDKNIINNKNIYINEEEN